MQSIRVHPIFAALIIVGLVIAGIAGAQQPQRFPRLTAEQAEILSHLSIVYLDDGQGGQAKTIRFTGVNVQVVNGLGVTNGNPIDPASTVAVTVNGVGNLIVGYNELGHALGDDRTGSHNIVAGIKNNYPSLGGLVASYESRLEGPYNGILGGRSNLSRDRHSVAIGGDNAVALSDRSFAAGGFNNVAANSMDVVVGGNGNTASGSKSSIFGGDANVTSANFATVLGGLQNNASGTRSTVVGGRFNDAAGNTSTVGGGAHRTATGEDDWVAGSLFQDN